MKTYLVASAFRRKSSAGCILPPDQPPPRLRRSAEAFAKAEGGSHEDINSRARKAEAARRRCGSRAAAVLLVLSAAAAAHAQTADDIVAKNIHAKGGAEKWKSLSSVKLMGRMSIQGKELPLTIYSKRPNLMRHETLLQDVRVVQAFDGTTAWAIHPMMGTNAAQELPPAAADMMKTSAEFEGALVDYRLKGHSVELVGPEKVDGKDVHHLVLTMKNGQVQHYYLDATTGLEARMTQEMDVGGGKAQTLATEMSDYRAVAGVTMPHTVRQLVDGKVVGQMTIDSVEFNSVTDDAIFKMPAK